MILAYRETCSPALSSCELAVTLKASSLVPPDTLRKLLLVPQVPDQPFADIHGLIVVLFVTGESRVTSS